MIDKHFLTELADQLSKNLQIRALSFIDKDQPEYLLFSYLPREGALPVFTKVSISEFSGGSTEAQTDQFLSILCEEVAALLRERHAQHNWALRCANFPCDDLRVKEDYARGCLFTATRTEKSDSNPNDNSSARRLVSEAMAPITNRLLDGNAVMFRVTVGEAATLCFDQLNIQMNIGACDEGYLMNEYMPGMLRFFGNEVRARRSAGEPVVQGAMLSHEDLSAGTFLFEMTVIYRDKKQLH